MEKAPSFAERFLETGKRVAVALVEKESRLVPYAELQYQKLKQLAFHRTDGKYTTDTRHGLRRILVRFNNLEALEREVCLEGPFFTCSLLIPGFPNN